MKLCFKKLFSPEGRIEKHFFGTTSDANKETHDEHAFRYKLKLRKLKPLQKKIQRQLEFLDHPKIFDPLNLRN